MRLSRLAIGIFVATALATLAVAGPLMSRIEQPNYQVLRSNGSIELRAYPALTVATTTVNGKRAAAINKGFRTLADYIFGANEASIKIEMTAPVMQGRGSAAVGEPTQEGDWAVKFVMPRDWSRGSLPTPRDPHILLETMPASTYAAIRFSGFWRDALLKQKTEELESYIASERLVTRGSPIYAYYNPPWTLPLFRRNEVMIEVER